MKAETSSPYKACTEEKSEFITVISSFEQQEVTVNPLITVVFNNSHLQLVGMLRFRIGTLSLDFLIALRYAHSFWAILNLIAFSPE